MQDLCARLQCFRCCTRQSGALLLSQPAPTSLPCSNALSGQPLRACKDGTEVEAAVAEELIALLEKAAANPKPAAVPAPAEGGDASPQRGAAGAAAGSKPAGATAAPAAVPGMVGAGLMGMPDPFMMVSLRSAALWCGAAGRRRRRKHCGALLSCSMPLGRHGRRMLPRALAQLLG